MLRLIVGVGSPYGSDQVGWSVVDRLKLHNRIDTRYINVSNPIDVLDYLGEFDELILVDAVHGFTANAIQCWTWPNPQIEDGAYGGSHGFGVVQMLELARELQLLPKTVTIVGIGVGLSPVSDFSTHKQDVEIEAIVEEVEAFYA